MTTIYENSGFRTRWDFLILTLVLVSCVLVPYQVAFGHDVEPAGTAILYLVDLFFLFDIALNFRTTYRVQGTVVTDRTRIARRYLRTFFLIDLLGALPFDALLFSWRHVEIGAVSIVLFARLLRLLRATRLFVIFHRWETQSWTNSGFLRIAKLLSVVLILIHWIACAWFLMPFMGGFPNDSWVASENLTLASPETQYIRSLYWAIVTMTTVGYGDITPSRDVEYVFTMVVMLLGASMYAFIIGNIASLFSNLDSTKAAYWNRVESINQYLRARDVPIGLNDRIREYYEYLWTRYRGIDHADLLTDLPPHLRLEVLLHLTAELREKVPLFKYSSPALRDALLLALRPAVFGPGTFIAREGEAGNTIFFIIRGEVEITSEHGAKRHCTLGEGEYFGALSLILGEKRTGSAAASTYCDVLLLTGDDFDSIKNEYGEFREILKRMSSEKRDKVSELVLEGVIL